MWNNVRYPNSENIFSEPEDDKFYETILSLRKRLGWVVDLPRHGPGGREAMDKLQDKPDPDKNVEVKLSLLFIKSCFYSTSLCDNVKRQYEWGNIRKNICLMCIIWNK